MDEASGWCLGCLRTLDEIASWATLDDAAKRGVLQGLAQRRLASRVHNASAEQTRPEA